MIGDASDLLGKLLDGGHSTIAGRLAGGFRNCGRGAIADEIIAAKVSKLVWNDACYPSGSSHIVGAVAQLTNQGFLLSEVDYRSDG